MQRDERGRFVSGVIGFDQWAPKAGAVDGASEEAKAKMRELIKALWIQLPTTSTPPEGDVITGHGVGGFWVDAPWKTHQFDPTLDWEYGPVQVSHWVDENGVVKCTCDMGVLLSEGCQCGAIKEERKREKDNALEEA